MNTNIATSNSIVNNGVLGSIDPELGIDVGATFKDYLRDQRIDRILRGAGNRSAKVRGGRRNAGTRTSRFTPGNADQLIPGTDWTYGQAAAMKKECDREQRLFGNRR